MSTWEYITLSLSLHQFPKICYSPGEKKEGVQPDPTLFSYSIYFKKEKSQYTQLFISFNGLKSDLLLAVLTAQ